MWGKRSGVHEEKTPPFSFPSTTLHFPFLVNPHFKVGVGAPQSELLPLQPTDPPFPKTHFWGGREEKRRKGHDGTDLKGPSLVVWGGAERPVGEGIGSSLPFYEPNQMPHQSSSSHA